MFWKRWLRRLGSSRRVKPKVRKKSDHQVTQTAEKTLDRLLQHPELFLQIIEHTDVSTALNFRLVNRSYRDLIDKYELSLSRAFVDRLDEDILPAGMGPPTTLLHLMGIHICRELAHICASPDRVPHNPYAAPEGIPPDDVFGDKLREQIANGFMVMWKLSHFVPTVNRLDREGLIELTNSEDLKGFVHEAMPWDQNTSEPSSLLSSAERESRKSLVGKLMGATDQQADFIARQKLLRKLWYHYAAKLSEQDRIDFHLARSRIPEDFTETDFPWEKQYDHHKVWNWVPASTELDAELWFDVYAIQKGPHFLYSLWCEHDKNKRAAAWTAHKEASSAVNDYEIASAIETRSYLFTLTAFGQTGLSSRARSDFDRAYGRYRMEHFYRKQGTLSPDDEDPLAFLANVRAATMTMCCFGGPDPNIKQKLWRQRAR